MGLSRPKIELKRKRNNCIFKSAIWVIPSQNVQTENPQKIDFAHIWCKGTPWGVIRESRIYLLLGQYFGFYGGLKFWGPWVSRKLQKAIS